MNWYDLLVVSQKFLVFGCIGWLVEVIFTGVASILHGDKKAVCQTYLWMAPLYGLIGLILEVMRAVPIPFWLKAPLLYVPLFYLAEFGYGWLLEHLIGVCPWNYGRGRWTPAGLINLKYAPFWLALALFADPLARILQVCVEAANKAFGA